MSPWNISRLVGKSQVWQYNGGCEYPCEFHKGKVEWHHPCSQYPKVGMYLCEAHHSLLLGRHHRYAGEQLIEKALAEMRQEIQTIIEQKVLDKGLGLANIDKR